MNNHQKNTSNNQSKTPITDILLKVSLVLIACLLYGLIIGIIFGLLSSGVVLKYITVNQIRFSFPFITTIFSIIGFLLWNNLPNMIQKAIQEKAEGENHQITLDNKKLQSELQSRNLEDIDSDRKREYEVVISKYRESIEKLDGFLILESKEEANNPLNQYLCRELTLRKLEPLELRKEAGPQAVLKLGDQNEDPLMELAICGAFKALGILDSNPREIEKSKDFQSLSRDIYIYLRVWLLMSVRSGRTIDHSEIVRKYPCENSSDVRTHISALNHIKMGLREYMEDFDVEEVFLDEAVKMFSKYLEQLIGYLQLESR